MQDKDVFVLVVNIKALHVFVRSFSIFLKLTYQMFWSGLSMDIFLMFILYFV